MQYDQRDIIPEIGRETVKLVPGMDNDLCEWRYRYCTEISDVVRSLALFPYLPQCAGCSISGRRGSLSRL